MCPRGAQVPDLDAALALVNSNEHGNGTAIFTRSGAAARKFQAEVDVGMVSVRARGAAPGAPARAGQCGAACLLPAAGDAAGAGGRGTSAGSAGALRHKLLASGCTHAPNALG